jgi:endonuclease/exonuclease/phosphatase family metal-dependent hydrolase
MSSLRVLTFNVRYDEPADGRNAWPNRRALAIETLLASNGDLVGLQEATEPQWSEIAAALADATAFGILRDEWGGVEPRGGFFRTSRFDELDSGVFWLSDTPSIAYSVSWPNDWGPRTCAWTCLHDRDANRPLVFATTHFDTNASSWLPSAQIVHRELDRIAGQTPIVLVGDFNCAADSDAHRYLLGAAGFRDVWREAGHADNGVVTYHGFRGATRVSPDFPPDAQHGNYRIYWILTRGLTCSASGIDFRRDGDLFPSDHYPVVAVVDYGESHGIPVHRPG